MTTVADLTERELVARIRARLAAPPDWLLVGIGDDAAVAAPERNRVEVLTVDAVIDGVHFDRRFTPPDAIGHRALAVNLSDLAAMGAAPRLALLSFALPSHLPVADFDAIVHGIGALAGASRVHVIGGNLTRTPGPLTIDITAIGTAKPRQVLVRGGARPGDAVYLSGSVGSAAAGLRMLRGDRPGVDAACVARYLRPAPRLRLGTLLGRGRVASACMDLSDGLADASRQIAEASGVGMMIDADALPIAEAARAAFDGDVASLVSSGDDYELLFTSGRRARGALRHVLRHTDVPVTRIGVCTDDRRVVLRQTVNARVEELPMPGGFTHFSSAVPQPR